MSNPELHLEPLASALIQKLQFLQQSLATAESCTGGLLASTLTDIPGASAVFWGGVVSYSNSAKARFLELPKDLLETKGAVSAEVAQAMAEGIQKASGATLGLATTGIAGPAGGTPEKPVGTIFLAIAHHGKPTIVWRESFPESRSLFKKKAVAAILRRCLTTIMQDLRA